MRRVKMTDLKSVINQLSARKSLLNHDSTDLLQSKKYYMMFCIHIIEFCSY